LLPQELVCILRITPVSALPMHKFADEPICHDRSKRAEEGKGYLADVGMDGWPIDPNHPANRGR